LAAQEGRLIDFLDGDALETVLVIQEAPAKLQVVTQFGKQKSIKASQVVCGFADAPTRGELSAAIAALHERIDALVREIDTELIWAGTEPKEKDCSLREYAEAYYGEAGGEHISALFRALMQDQTRFKRNGLAFRARSEAQAEALLLAEERERDKKARELAIRAWLAGLASGYDTPEADEIEQKEDTAEGAHEKQTANEKEFTQALATFLLERRESDVSRVFCQAYRENPRESAYEILSRLGLLPADCNPIKLIAGINPEFSHAALAEALALPDDSPSELLGETGASLGEPEPDRLDRTALPAFSIDDALTTEIDDALTVEFETRDNKESIRIGVHIADVASLIPVQGALDREAQARTLTVYLPEEIFAMFPKRIGSELASLKEGAIRRAISLFVEFDAETFLPLGREFRATYIRNAHRLTYDEVDEVLSGASHPLSETLHKASAVAERLKATRLANNAFLITRPELHAHVENGEITLTVIQGASPARSLVQEFMILYNSSAARFAKESSLPVIYRVQGKPEGKDFPLGQELRYEPQSARQLFKRIRPAHLSLEPGAHAGLGEAAYIQVSSPIRRYSDLIMQRQLLAAVKGRRPVYEQGELYRVLAAVEDTSREISAIERRSVRFWALEYLAREGMERSYTATALLPIAGGTLIELEEYPLRAVLEHTRARAGEKVAVRITQVDARRDILNTAACG